MTAPNHALTGALIGLSVSNPLLAAPLALLSHLVCDAIPHYDQDTGVAAERIYSKRFLYEQIIIGGVLCLLLVLLLALTRPQHWLLAAVCAFLAASPDLLWVPRYLYIKRTGKDVELHGWYWFHNWIQWKAGPKFIWLEAAWFVACSALLLRSL